MGRRRQILRRGPRIFWPFPGAEFLAQIDYGPNGDDYSTKEYEAKDHFLTLMARSTEIRAPSCSELARQAP